MLLLRIETNLIHFKLVKPHKLYKHSFKSVFILGDNEIISIIKIVGTYYCMSKSGLG